MTARSLARSAGTLRHAEARPTRAGLNEYPVGSTEETIRFGTPKAIIFLNASGNAASDEVVEKAISAGGSKIWFVPITYRGESCYRVFWGRYATREHAERGAGEIPASIRGGKPTVVSPGSS